MQQSVIDVEGLSCKRGGELHGGGQEYPAGAFAEFCRKLHDAYGHELEPDLLNRELESLPPSCCPSFIYRLQMCCAVLIECAICRRDRAEAVRKWSLCFYKTCRTAIRFPGS